MKFRPLLSGAFRINTMNEMLTKFMNLQLFRLRGGSGLIISVRKQSSLDWFATIRNRNEESVFADNVAKLSKRMVNLPVFRLKLFLTFGAWNCTRTHKFNQLEVLSSIVLHRSASQQDPTFRLNLSKSF